MQTPTLTPPPGRTTIQVVPQNSAPLNNVGPNRPLRSRRLFRQDTIFGRFQILAALLTVLAIIALILCTIALNATETNMREIVTRLTPTLEAARRLGQAVEEMDARAADYQLTYRIDVSSPDLVPAVYGPTGLRNSLWNDLEQKRLAADNALAQVRAQVRTPAEREAISYISNRFYEYFAQVRLMRYELDLGHKEAALRNYKAAQDVLIGTVGNVPLDAQGNSQEKLLKDNNWKDVSFTCVTSCPAGAANKAVAVGFDNQATYQGIAANIQKVAEINEEQLAGIEPVSPLISLLVIVSAGLVTLLALAVVVYYALATHRVLNPGFALAFLVGLGVAISLVSTLNAATNDYRQFINQDVRGITLASVTQQMTADAGADISRLLLSPDSPGLDSTSQSLTAEVKRAFNPDSLKTAFASKQKQIYEKLNDLWVLSDTTVETNALCKINIGPNGNQRCSPGRSFSWDQFLNGVKQVQDRFDRRLLADAIQINITPKSDPAQNLASAREPYNQFLAALDEFGTLNKANFNSRACNALAVSEFGSACPSGTTGYINLLQIVVWIAFPLVVLFAAGGIWSASRLF